MRNRSNLSSPMPRRATGRSDAQAHPEPAAPSRPGHADAHPDVPVVSPFGAGPARPTRPSHPVPDGASVPHRASAAGPGVPSRPGSPTRIRDAGPARSGDAQRPGPAWPGGTTPYDEQGSAADYDAHGGPQTTNDPAGTAPLPGFASADDPMITVTQAHDWVGDDYHNDTPGDSIPDFVGSDAPLPDVTITPAKSIGIPDPAQLPLTMVSPVAEPAVPTPPRQEADPTRPRPSVTDPSDYHVGPTDDPSLTAGARASVGALVQPQTPARRPERHQLPVEQVPSPVASGSIPIHPTPTSQFAAATAAAASPVAAGAGRVPASVGAGGPDVMAQSTTLRSPAGAQRLPGSPGGDVVTLRPSVTDGLVLAPLREYSPHVRELGVNDHAPFVDPDSPPMPVTATALTPSLEAASHTEPKPGSRRALREQRRTTHAAPAADPEDEAPHLAAPDAHGTHLGETPFGVQPDVAPFDARPGKTPEAHPGVAPYESPQAEATSEDQPDVASFDRHHGESSFEAHSGVAPRSAARAVDGVTHRSVPAAPPRPGMSGAESTDFVAADNAPMRPTRPSRPEPTVDAVPGSVTRPSADHSGAAESADITRRAMPHRPIGAPTRPSAQEGDAGPVEVHQTTYVPPASSFVGADDQPATPDHDGYPIRPSGAAARRLTAPHRSVAAPAPAAQGAGARRVQPPAPHSDRPGHDDGSYGNTVPHRSQAGHGPTRPGRAQTARPVQAVAPGTPAQQSAFDGGPHHAPSSNDAPPKAAPFRGSSADEASYLGNPGEVALLDGAPTSVAASEGDESNVGSFEGAAGVTPPVRPAPSRAVHPHNPSTGRTRRGVTLDEQQVTASQDSAAMPGRGGSIMGRPTRPHRT